MNKPYNIGQEVEVYYNPETDKIFEKGINKQCYIYGYSSNNWFNSFNSIFNEIIKRPT